MRKMLSLITVVAVVLAALLLYGVIREGFSHAADNLSESLGLTTTLN